MLTPFEPHIKTIDIFWLLLLLSWFCCSLLLLCVVVLYLYRQYWLHSHPSKWTFGNRAVILAQQKAHQSKNSYYTRLSINPISFIWYIRFHFPIIRFFSFRFVGKASICVFFFFVFFIFLIDFQQLNCALHVSHRFCVCVCLYCYRSFHLIGFIFFHFVCVSVFSVCLYSAVIVCVCFVLIFGWK